MKLVFKIVALILILFLLGIGIYLGWRKIIGTPPEGPTGNGGITPPANTGTSETIKLKKLSDNPVFDYWVYGEEIYYLGVDGRVFAAKNDADTEISRETLNALNGIKRSPNGSAVLVAFDDPTNPSWGIFDSRDKVWRPLDPNILNAGWGGDDETIFALVRSGNILNLSEIDLLKPSSPKVLVRDLRLKDVDIFWKPPQALLFAEKASAFYSSRLWQLDLKPQHSIF